MREEKLSLFQIKKSKFWTGILIFIVQSIAIYSFCNMLMDTVRVTCYFDREYYILSEMERYYYNLIFAFLGLITGYHSFLKWMVKPPLKINLHKTFPDRKNWRDQFYHSDVLFYILFALIIFCGRIYFIIPGLLLDLSPVGYLWLFPFFVLLAYFLSIFLIFSKKRIKFRILFIFSSFLTITILALALANFNTLHYKKWDDHFLEINPHLNCTFKISESRVYDDLYFNRPRRLSPIYFYHNRKGSLEVIFNHSKIDTNSISNALKNYLLKVDEPLKSVPVYLDRKVSFEQFDQFRKVLYDHHITWIQIIIKDPENYYPFNNTMEKVIQYKMSDYLFHPMNKKDFEKELSNISNIIHITLIDFQTYQINGKNIPSDSLKSRLKTLIQEDSNYLIQYQYKKDITFGLYFNLFIQAKETLYEINTQQVIDSKNSELFLYPKNENGIPFLILEEVTEK